MTSKLQPMHCVLQNNPAWPVNPLPEKAGAVPLPPPAADWQPLLEQYRQGDKSCFNLLCCKATPLVDNISHEPYFAAALGKEEAYSIAAMTMVSFWDRIPLQGSLQNIPGKLYHAMECDLLNQIKRHKTRSRREVHYETGGETEDKQPEPPADSKDEPEQQVLQAEWNRKVRNCLQHLGKKERQVIHSYFFRQLTVTEIARELHCTPDSVTSAKRVALKKLRNIFAEEQVV